MPTLFSRAISYHKLMMNDRRIQNSQTNERISTIAGINKDGQKINLLGIVLQKSGVRRIETRDFQQGTRGVFSFVLRDNVTSWINIIYWGSSKSSGELSASFSIGKLTVGLCKSLKVTSYLYYKGKRK